MPPKKKKYKARFPPARIKKIMQTDEEVGKVAAAVPVIISRSLEIFLNALLTKGSEIAEQRKAKTLTPQHLKWCIEKEKQFDFLRDLVSSVPDVRKQADSEAGDGEQHEKRKRQRRKNDDDSGLAANGKKRKKQPESHNDEASSEDASNNSHDEDNAHTTGTSKPPLLVHTQSGLSLPPPLSSLSQPLPSSNSNDKLLAVNYSLNLPGMSTVDEDDDYDA
ncbi:dr1-associated corepressor-like [Corticium candelabrum]|uniref:dr1-associated corepressor-like n=1 Tax=Corticium candelabrum TaxID=121492 RepID=UPI002E276C09|nr:dr1-associated corepressor-like [Corticium candelabrum]